MKRNLVLENGLESVGSGFGSQKEEVAQIVFNTAVVGYQEILSDPSNTDLMLCMTYPLIGNYGITDDDYESRIISPKALIVREYNDKPSNFRYTKTLNELLEENDVVGISHVDTRSITRIIRENGTMTAIITDVDTSTQEALQHIKNYKESKQLIAKVSCKKLWYSRCSNPKYNVVIIDCGIKFSIIKKLNSLGFNVTIVPFNTSVTKIQSLAPDAIIISNGPGNPSDAVEVIETVKLLQGKYPMLGISLGHQIIGLANNMECSKLKVGHRGINRPVRNNKTNKITIVNQNHGYALNNKNNDIEITYVDILDDCIEGLNISKDMCFGVQFYPTDNVYEEFINVIKNFKGEN